jgi:hypothetical protein
MPPKLRFDELAAIFFVPIVNRITFIGEVLDQCLVYRAA